MQNLNHLLTDRRKASYDKLKDRFIKSLNNKTFEEKSKRQKRRLLTRIKELEGQLGLRSTTKLKHWAVAFALGIVTTVGAQKAEAQTDFTFEAGEFIGDIQASPITTFGDLDGDGDQDFIRVSAYSNQIHIFSNDGSGNFSASQVLTTDEPISGNQYYNEFSFIGDVDNDGDMDIIVAQTVEGYGYESSFHGIRVHCFTNEGGASFTKATSVFDDNRLVGEPAILDIDGDGDLEIVAVTDYYYYGSPYGRYTNILQGDANNNFSVAEDFGVSDYNEIPAQLGDMDGDGDMDIVTWEWNSVPDPSNPPYYYSPAIVFTIYQNEAGVFTDGSGTPLVTSESIAYGVSNDVNGPNMDIGDINGDGFADFIGVTQGDDNTILVLENNQDGTFSNSPGFYLADEVYNTHSLYEPRLVDLDGDGDLDIISEHWNSVFDPVYGTSESYDSKIVLTQYGLNTGTFLEFITGPDVSIGETDAIIGLDVDGDADFDLIKSNGYNILVLKNNGSNSFSVYDDQVISVVSGYESIAFDLDGDGDTDIINTGNSQILLNDGNGNFSPGQSLTDYTNDRSYSVAAGDFDLDGDIDIILGSYSTNSAVLWINDGYANFTPNTTINMDYVSNIYDIAMTSIDGVDLEGDLDIISIGSTNEGYNFFSTKTNSSLGSELIFIDEGQFEQRSFKMEAMQIADFNGDGFPEVVTSGNSTVTLWANSGGTFTDSTLVIAEANFEQLAVGDVDGDGDMDVIVLNEYASEAYNYLFRFDGTNLVKENAPINSNATGNVLLVDLDGDGDLDAHIGGSYDSEDEIWLNDGTGNFNLEFSLSGIRSFYTTAGDFDNDGDNDIFTSVNEVGNRVLYNAVYVPPQPNANEYVALLNIYSSLGGSAWTDKSGWGSTQSISEWFGLTTEEINGELRVTELNLPGNNLMGKIDQNLFAPLTYLRSVNMQGNGLSGSLPAEFLTLPNLEVIKLANNSLSGVLPAPEAESTLTWKVLELQQNKLYGTLPSTGSYPALERLKLDSNRFEGSVTLPLATMGALSLLELDNNLFSGTLPDVTGLSFLDSLDASNNAFTGSIPASFSSLEGLSYLNLSNNQLTGSTGTINSRSSINVSNNQLTDISGLSLLAQIDARNNWLDFGDFEALSGGDGSAAMPENLLYYPQQNLFDRVDSLHNVGEQLTISYEIGGDNNVYEWRKAALSKTNNFVFSVLPDSTNSSINFDNPDSPNEGAYRLVVTNTLFPSDTIKTSAFLLKITSLERDVAALIDLMDSTSGFDPTNWGVTEITAGDWEGVTLNQSNTRVTGLSLPGTTDRNLEGNVPESFADMTGLQTIDLSGNQLRSFPNITGMLSLVSANISGNRLSFNDLIPNKSIKSKLTYSPQRRYGETDYDTLDAGANYLLEIENLGKGSTYQWYFGEYKPGQRFNNDTNVEKGTNRFQAINDLDYDQQGTYRVYVSHPDFDNLTIQSRNKNIMAKTDLQGTVRKNDAPLTTGAEIFIWRKTPAGPFVKEDSAGVNTSNGTYSFTDVVLGDFVVQVKPNRQADSTTLQTYYIASESYKDADVLALRTDTAAIDIDILFYEQATIDPEGATIKGSLIADFDETEVDEEGNRIQARRKVRKAACSMRRFKSQGRPGQDAETEIAYYIETDDEGYFNFDGVEPGTYLINIEFPGVPMDPSSEVEFEISEDKENQVFEVDALIKETGIEITQTEVLFNWKPFVKEVNLYPNPTAGVLGIDYLVYRNIDDLKIEVLNVQGSKVLESKINHIKGMHNTTLDMSNFESGMYFIIFTDEKATFRHEFKVTRK